MNPRQAQLIELLEQQGTATIEELAERFDVTLQTVRRDVQMLSRDGLITRFHGGVSKPVSTKENIEYRQRQGLMASEKLAIAQAVAAEVRDGMTLMMNLGTTMEAVASALMNHRQLTVITNNLNVAGILADNPDCEVIVAGGTVRHRDKGITGDATVAFMRQFKVDIGLIGLSGIEQDGTLRDFDFQEVQVTRTILKQCRQSWLAADRSKFGRPAMVQLGRLEEIDVLFTDSVPEAGFETLIEQAGTELRLCGC